jgi:hypothetical protein
MNNIFRSGITVLMYKQINIYAREDKKWQVI